MAVLKAGVPRPLVHQAIMASASVGPGAGSVAGRASCPEPRVLAGSPVCLHCVEQSGTSGQTSGSVQFPLGLAEGGNVLNIFPMQIVLVTLPYQQILTGRSLFPALSWVTEGQAAHWGD